VFFDDGIFQTVRRDVWVKFFPDASTSLHNSDGPFSPRPLLYVLPVVRTLRSGRFDKILHPPSFSPVFACAFSFNHPDLSHSFPGIRTRSQFSRRWDPVTLALLYNPGEAVLGFSITRRRPALCTYRPPSCALTTVSSPALTERLFFFF